MDDPILAKEGFTELLKYNLFLINQIVNNVDAQTNSTNKTFLRRIHESNNHKSSIEMQLYVKLLCCAIQDKFQL